MGVALDSSPPAYQSLLQTNFHLQDFRLGQEDIIRAVLGKKDVLAVLPTGGGKSLCFQFAAIYSQQLVIVISPLIALMKDQVNNLGRLGIPSGALHSGQTDDEKRKVFADIQKGGAYLLYLSPERAQKEGFQRWVANRPIALFAIDEAHCVSQWGHDFREEYSQLKILKKLRPDVPILALTASATPAVLHDISINLMLDRPERMVHGFYRPNLYYQVEPCADEREKKSLLVEAISRTPEGRIIVYCGTRKVAEEVSEFLQTTFRDALQNKVAFYHAGLAPNIRNATQAAYSAGDTRILVATNAFGMGIDQPNVRLVVHYQMPSTIDALYQEMGRAGRDGHPSTCLMLYAKKDKGLQSYFIQTSEAPTEIKNARWRNLDALVNYSEGGECRHAEILTYYRDSQRIESCGHCDTCDPASARKVPRPILEPIAARTKNSKSRSPTKGPGATKAPILLDISQDARFQNLKRWRKEKAKELDVPAFVIFSDQTLRHLAVENPKDLESMKRVYGIGEAKLEKFGREVLTELYL